MKKHGARNLIGSGLTSGDNTEHVWAELRPLNKSTKYQSEASSLDVLHDAVRRQTGVMASVCCSVAFAEYLVFTADPLLGVFSSVLSPQIVQLGETKADRLPSLIWRTLVRSVKTLSTAESDLAKYQSQLDDIRDAQGAVCCVSSCAALRVSSLRYLTGFGTVR